jgi:hypothetical protein
MGCGKITLIPLGGLCNRMRSIAAGISLSEGIESQLHVLWFKNDKLYANFHDLFEAPASFSISEISDKPVLRQKVIAGLCGKSRRKIFRYVTRLRFDLILQELETGYVNNAELVKQFQSKKVLISAHTNFNAMVPPSFTHFNPLPALALEISDFSRQFNEAMVGLHIRRTDNVKAIQNSPTEKYIDLVDKKIQEDSSARFFLATDCPETQRIFSERYNDKVLFREKQFGRNSLQGMESSLIDLYLLSRCCKVIGSYYSSFSHTAADIGNIPEITVKA